MAPVDDAWDVFLDRRDPAAAPPTRASLRLAHLILMHPYPSDAKFTSA